MVILVTGVAGFVGAQLAQVLLGRGDQVVGIDNLNDYYPLEHKLRRLVPLQKHPNFTFIQADLCDFPALQAIFARYSPHSVAHLAAMAAVRYSVQHPLIYGQVNVQGSMNLMEAAKLHGNPNLVLASTGSVYGKDTPVPFPINAAATSPLAPYPASKRSMELMAHCYHHLWQLPITILRFFNVYGPAGRPDMMPWQWTFDIKYGRALQLYGAGKLKRDWTYIDDIVSGFVLALDKKLPWQILNLGCGNPVENIRFVQVLESLIGIAAIKHDAPIPPSEPLITYADISQTKAILGWKPKVQIEEGLQRFIAWVKDNQLL